MTDILQHAYCINLDHRKDRWEHAQLQFTSNGLNVERVSAVNGDSLSDVNGSHHKYAMGCAMSHLAVLEKAKELDLDHVLIFEDDVVLCDKFRETVEKSIGMVPPDWTMIYFGGGHISPLEHVIENIFKLKYTFTTHAYVIRKCIYDIVISNIPHLTKPIDVFYAELHSQLPCYLIKGEDSSLAWQMVSYSDINRCMTNYINLQT